MANPADPTRRRRPLAAVLIGGTILAVVVLGGFALALEDAPGEPVRTVTEVCGEDPGPVCTFFWERTGSELVAVVAGRVLPTILAIGAIIAVAYVINRLIRRAIRRFVRSITSEGLERMAVLRQRSGIEDSQPIDLARATARTQTIGGVLRSVTTVIIWAIAATTVLSLVGIPIGPLIASAGIAGVAIGFGAQNLVKDFLSGIFMLMEDQYGIGDIIDTGEATGIVEAISLRTTRVRDVNGTVWYVPNGEIRRIGNFSQQWARALLDIGVAYDTDVAHASAVIKGVADEVWSDPEWSEKVLSEPEVWGVENFGPNEIIIRLVIQTAPMKQWEVAREIRRRLKGAFDAEGIEIPFPQRTVWMHQMGGEAAATAANED